MLLLVVDSRSAVGISRRGLTLRTHAGEISHNRTDPDPGELQEKWLIPELCLAAPPVPAGGVKPTLQEVRAVKLGTLGRRGGPWRTRTSGVCGADCAAAKLNINSAPIDGNR